MQSDKRAVEASETGDSFSDSLNEELNAVKNEPETSNQNNVCVHLMTVWVGVNIAC
jgi:hypothetical protein